MIKKKEKKEDKTVGETILNDALKAIQTKFGEGSILKFGDSPKVNVSVIPTGSIGLDMALGIGGIPRGRIWTRIFRQDNSLSPHRRRSAKARRNLRVCGC